VTAGSIEAPQSGGFLIREPKVQKLDWHRAGGSQDLASIFPWLARAPLKLRRLGRRAWSAGRELRKVSSRQGPDLLYAGPAGSSQSLTRS
jgi:hypothetical protein